MYRDLPAVLRAGIFQSRLGVGMLKMKSISKSFGSNMVLDNVDFEINSSEIVALLGANGAGKSTLMKIMTGIYTKDFGMIEIDGKEVQIGSPSDAMVHGIRLVPQELQIVPDLSVAENIFIGAFPTSGSGPFATVRKDELNQKATEILQDLGIEKINVREKLSAYSISEQRLVEIARSLAGDARILVMDEPTASLSEPECKRLFEILDRLKTKGVSIIFISHFLDEVFEICDRIEVLRDGKNAGSFSVDETDHHTVLTSMLGREPSDLYPEHSNAALEDIFVVNGARKLPNIQDVSFKVRQGEIHGVFGLIGSGIEHLGKMLFGGTHMEQGEVLLDGEKFDPQSPNDSIEYGVGFVSGERKSEGIVPDLPLQDNLTLPYLKRHKSGLEVSTRSQSNLAKKWIDTLGIVTSGPQQPIGGLSGGNQQKVCIARWLVNDLRVLILEEPTRGVDLGARKDIYAQLRKLSNSGLAVVVISSDAEEIAGLADTSTVLIDGKSVEYFDTPIEAPILMKSAMREIAV